MNYSDYVNHIEFRFYKPWMNPIGYRFIESLLGKLNISFEILNTRLPENKETKIKTLAEVCSIPRMSTFAVGAMINEAVSRMSDSQAFVNVGVWNGFTFLSGISGNPNKKCIGVDNFSEFGGPRKQFLQRFNRLKADLHDFHDMDYKDYFNSVHNGEIGFYIYDGEHSYLNQLDGLRVAEPYFSEDCIILIDDTNLDAPRLALDTFLKESKNSYEVILDEFTYDNLHPTLWNGIIIIQRIKE